MKLRTIINIPREQQVSSPRPSCFALPAHGVCFVLGLVLLNFLVSGCFAVAPDLPESSGVPRGLIVGRTLTVLTGDRGRAYRAEVVAIELIEQSTGMRREVSVSAEGGGFSLKLRSGVYRVNRVKIREGPFRSIAQLSGIFTVPPGTITHVGVWRFGVGSPRHDRTVLVSIVPDRQEFW